MPKRNFMELLQAQWDAGNSACVGLDSDAGRIPILHLGMNFLGPELLAAQGAYQLAQRAKPGTRNGILTQRNQKLLADAMLAFNKRIVDATKDLVCAYKPNSAFYEALGSAGMQALVRTIDYIHQVAPDVVVIIDCKRGDIDSTNTGYVMASAMADAVTVSPYLGAEAMKPFLDNPNKGAIVLCRTTNTGAGEFQDLVVGPWKIPLYLYVALRVARNWNYNGNCAVVAGATVTTELEKVRQAVGDMPILIPGIGAQQGDLEATVKAGANSRKQGMIISNSRHAIFASDGPDFPEASRKVVMTMRDETTAVLTAA